MGAGGSSVAPEPRDDIRLEAAAREFMLSQRDIEMLYSKFEERDLAGDALVTV